MTSSSRVRIREEVLTPGLSHRKSPPQHMWNWAVTYTNNIQWPSGCGPRGRPLPAGPGEALDWAPRPQRAHTSLSAHLSEESTPRTQTQIPSYSQRCPGCGSRTQNQGNTVQQAHSHTGRLGGHSRLVRPTLPILLTQECGHLWPGGFGGASSWTHVEAEACHTSHTSAWSVTATVTRVPEEAPGLDHLSLSTPTARKRNPASLL